MISHWSIAGILFGFLFALDSSIRYYSIYPDFDKFIAYTTLGLLIIAVSWLYGENLNNKNKLTAIEDYLAER